MIKVVDAIIASAVSFVVASINKRVSKGIIEKIFLSAGFEELDRDQKPGHKICNVLYVRTP